MSVLDRPDLVPVQLDYCPCEGTPHPDGDIVYLLPELPAPAGVRARAFFQQAMTGTIDAATAEESIAALWLSMCVAEWTFLLDDGRPIPVTPENVVRALPYGKGGRQVADKADDLYVESVTAPLLEELARLSKRGSTPSSRPATRPNPTSRQKPRKRSSTATTATVQAPG
jgi:hypothetical protein